MSFSLSADELDEIASLASEAMRVAVELGASVRPGGESNIRVMLLRKEIADAVRIRLQRQGCWPSEMQQWLDLVLARAEVLSATRDAA